MSKHLARVRCALSLLFALLPVIPSAASAQSMALSFDDAVAMVMGASAGFRLPEPQREADRFAAEVKQRHLSGKA